MKLNGIYNKIIFAASITTLICTLVCANTNALDGAAMPVVPVPEVPQSIPNQIEIPNQVSDPALLVPQVPETVVTAPQPSPAAPVSESKQMAPEKNTSDNKQSSEYDDEMMFNEPEQVFEEDKEAIVEDNSRVYPKWQGRRKKPTKDNEFSIRVNKETCTVTVYLKEENGDLTPYKAMVCSIGREGHDTPEGKGYKTSDYYDWRLMVDNTYGRYAVRFNGSIMFHSVPYYKSKKNSLEWQDYNKLGMPASLGCIRLAVADAKWIFDNCKRGTEVEVYSGPASTDPLGTPEPIKLDTKSEYRDWDPTDLTKENPWLVPVE